MPEAKYYKNRKVRIGPKGGKYILVRGEKRYVPKKKHHSRDGRSNVGKYKNVSKSKFCGPAGGAARGSYPVNTRKRCSAALSYARFAPKPCGIARCVQRKCPKDVGKSSKLMRRCTSRFGTDGSDGDNANDAAQRERNLINLRQREAAAAAAAAAAVAAPAQPGGPFAPGWQDRPIPFGPQAAAGGAAGPLPRLRRQRGFGPEDAPRPFPAHLQGDFFQAQMRRLQAQPALQLAAPNNELQQRAQNARERQEREAQARAREARARHRARAYDLYDAENVPLPDPEPGEDF